VTKEFVRTKLKDLLDAVVFWSVWSGLLFFLVGAMLITLIEVVVKTTLGM
jgi:hypothetical protein